MDNDKIMKNVFYLEEDDINDDGSLKKHVGNGDPVIIMAQGNFCPHCTTAKPAYQKLSTENCKAVPCTILIDGEQSEKAASKFLKMWDSNHRGVPAYFGFDKDGKCKGVHNGGRDTKCLLDFANNL